MRRHALLAAAIVAAMLTPVVPASADPAGSTTAAPLLPKPVPVSGRVTEAASGDPIAGACVSVRTPDSTPWWEGMGCTDGQGRYAFSLAPGRYEVEFAPPSTEVAPQWWPAATSPAEAGVLVVRRGKPVTGIDAELAVGATITGRAFEPDGSPMDVCAQVSAAGTEEDFIGGLHGSPDGRFTIEGLPAGELTVVVRRCGNWYRNTWAYDALTVAEATSFQLTAGATTNVGRIDLVEGATLSGRVVSRRTGAPLEDIVVADAQNIRSGEPTAFRARTDEDGRFHLEDVQPGVWNPLAYDYPLDWSEGGPRWAFGWRDGARDPKRAEPTVLEPGGQATVDFRLDRAAKIVGTLKDYDGRVNLDAVLPDSVDEWWPFTVGIAGYWSETDEFVIHGLPATKVLVWFRHSDDLGEFWYDGVRDPDDATVIKLKPGRTVRIEAQLPD